jgi:two-component system, OmpR family, response regulator
MSRGNLESILYVEDDGDIQTVAQIALEVVGGFQLKTCSSGKESIEVAGGFKPDLLLLDVMMPEMDGPTTLESLRKCPNTATTPVIFMTAKVQTNEVNFYKSLGALGVIAKPFDPMKLAGQVQSLWDEI